jgi:hypothetical protein
MPVFGRKPKQKPQAELLSYYGQELGRSKEWRETEGYDDCWTDMVDLYRGESIFPTAGRSSEDRIAINQAFSTINVIYPAISVSRPEIAVAANQPDLETRAVFVQAMINHQWERYRMQEPFRRAVKDSLIVGHGWCKMLWSYEEAEKELTEEEFALRFQAALADEQAIAAEEEREPVTDEELARQIIAASRETIVDRPVMERISPHDMFVNPEATSLEDARWVAQRIVRHIDDVKTDPAYSRKARDNAMPGLTLADPHYARHQENYESNELVEVFEFYDLARQTMCTFAAGAAEYLIRPRKMPYAFGHPFEMIRNYEVPDHFYPMGDLEMIAPLVKELSKTRSEMMNHRARYARKYLARKAAISQSDLTKIASKRDGEVIFVEDDSVPLADVIQPVNQIGMDPGLYNWSQAIENDIQDISGITEFMRGGGGQIRRTATEASLLQDAANVRTAEKLDRVETFIANLATKLLQINQQYVTGEQAAKVIGRDGANLWVPYTREDIKGQYDFRVEAGSTVPKNETFRRQSALGMLQALGPFIQTGQVNVPELLRIVLRDGFAIKNPEKFLQEPPPPPQAQGMPAGVNGQAMQALGAGGGVGVDAPQLEPQAQADADAAAQLGI